MKNSLLIISFFALGVLIGRFIFLPKTIIQTDISLYALYILLLLVGIGVGSDAKTRQALKNLNIRILSVPLSVIIGTFIGASLFSIFIPGLRLKESLAIAAGFGYYSLSSILIAQISGNVLGTIALLSNLSREIITLLFAPLMVKYFGKIAPIASGGATSMDTTLPIITKFSGKEYAIIAVFNGLVLTLLVPFLITLILK